MRAQLLALVAVIAFGSGCVVFKAVGLAPKGDPPKGGIVHTWSQGSDAGHANIYWFETPAGPVVVDAPLTISEAKKLRSSMARPTRLYISAARPERYGAIAALTDGGVHAYSTTAVAAEITQHGDGRLAPFHKLNPEDVPSHTDAPIPAIEERTHDMIGEIEVELLPLGPAESEASLALFLPKTGELIAGDVVAGHDHVDLTWGRSVAWQERLVELKALAPRYVYPGHGKPGGPELLDETLAYLKFFHDAVAARVKPNSSTRINPADMQAIRQQILVRYPKLGRSELLERSIPAEYAVEIAALGPNQAIPGSSEAAKALIQGGAADKTSAKPAATSDASAPATVKPAAARSSAGGGGGLDDLLGGGPAPGKKKKKSKK